MFIGIGTVGRIKWGVRWVWLDPPDYETQINNIMSIDILHINDNIDVEFDEP